jgi:hypothetical protein
MESLIALMSGRRSRHHRGHSLGIQSVGRSPWTVYVSFFETITECRKWFLAEIGHVGLNNLLAAYTDKGADAICTFAYSAGPGADVEILEGVCEVLPHKVYADSRGVLFLQEGQIALDGTRYFSQRDGMLHSQK